MRVDSLVRRLPFFWRYADRFRPRFPGSKSYWEERYASGGNSGHGSVGQLAAFKAEILNGFVKENAVQSIIEFGCGDGRQLMLAEYTRYAGLDVSPTVIRMNIERFAKIAARVFFSTRQSTFTTVLYSFPPRWRCPLTSYFIWLKTRCSIFIWITYLASPDFALLVYIRPTKKLSTPIRMNGIAVSRHMLTNTFPMAVNQESS